MGLWRLLSQPNGLEPWKFLRHWSKTMGHKKTRTCCWSQTNLRSSPSQGLCVPICRLRLHEAIVWRGSWGWSLLHSVSQAPYIGLCLPWGKGGGSELFESFSSCTQRHIGCLQPWQYILVAFRRMLTSPQLRLLFCKCSKSYCAGLM